MERAGTNDKGSITAFYTVLADGDDMNDPIVDKVRGTLDGHIVLNRKLAQAYHYPAIDVLASISRLSNRVSGKMTKKASGLIRTLMAAYADKETMITAGIYQKGNSAAVDIAIDKHEEIEEFLKQEEYEPCTMEETLKKQGIRNVNACIAYIEEEDQYLTNDSMYFHEHFGYELVGTFHKCAWKFDKWYDMIWMEKMIAEHGENPEDIIPFPNLS